MLGPDEIGRQIKGIVFAAAIIAALVIAYLVFS